MLKMWESSMVIEDILEDIRENVEENPNTELINPSEKNQVEKKPTEEVASLAYENYLLKEEDLKNLSLKSILRIQVNHVLITIQLLLIYFLKR